MSTSRLLPARSEERRLVHEIGEVRTRESRGAACDDVGPDIRGHGHLAHVDEQDLLAAANIGQRHDHLPVESTRAQERRIEDVGTVGGGDHDHPGIGLEAVHFNEKLIQRLLALVVPAAQSRAALASHGVDLVDEHDAGRMLLRLLEHVAHARRAHADEHLDEVGARDREERALSPRPRSPSRAASYPFRGCPPSTRRAECGPPSFWNLDGSRRNSTSSATSSLASSQPATSANVMVLFDSSSMRARLLPNENAPPRPAALHLAHEEDPYPIRAASGTTTRRCS
jgi:hypothetical protein